MVTITEDYVSFETAKLLKEKGFDAKCNKCYAYFADDDIRCIDLKYRKSVQLLIENRYPCVTLQMAMKWLREDKKILTSIFCHIDKGYWFCIQHFIDSPYKFATSESIHRKEEILGKIQYYDTYEEACEASIKYCLENLI